MKRLQLLIISTAFGLSACAPSSPDVPAPDTQGAPLVLTGAMKLGAPSEEYDVVLDKRVCAGQDFGPPFSETGTFLKIDWNDDPATVAVAIDRTDAGFRMNVPYNPAWGSPDLECQVPAAQEFMTGISFSFAGPFEGGGVTRFARLALLPARTAADAVAAIEATQEQDGAQGGSVPPNGGPAVFEINGNTVVRHRSSGFCEVQTTYEIIGKKFNYQLGSVCDIDKAGVEYAVQTFTVY
jgi:hypothetical protein